MNQILVKISHVITIIVLLLGMVHLTIFIHNLLGYWLRFEYSKIIEFIILIITGSAVMYSFRKSNEDLILMKELDCKHCEKKERNYE